MGFPFVKNVGFLTMFSIHRVRVDIGCVSAENFFDPPTTRTVDITQHNVCDT
jgi:hypothetical protein